jgi:hypothetical protein
LILAAAGAVPSSFTPDGKTLLFSQAAANGRSQIMVLQTDADSATPHPLRESSANDVAGQISPDGKWVAFTSNESGRLEVYVLPFPGPGAKTQVSADGGVTSRWSASGRELFFWDQFGSGTLHSSTIQLSPFTAAPQQKLFTAIGGSTWGVAPDGQHFLVETVQNGGVIVTVTNWFDELRRRAPIKK